MRFLSFYYVYSSSSSFSFSSVFFFFFFYLHLLFLSLLFLHLLPPPPPPPPLFPPPSYGRLVERLLISTSFLPPFHPNPLPIFSSLKVLRSPSFALVLLNMESINSLINLLILLLFYILIYIYVETTSVFSFLHTLLFSSLNTVSFDMKLLFSGSCHVALSRRYLPTVPALPGSLICDIWSVKHLDSPFHLARLY